MNVCACMNVHHMHVVPLEAKRGHGTTPGAEVTDDCELPCVCWELNLSPLYSPVM